MIDFYDYLSSKSLQGLLNPVEFTIPQFTNLPDVMDVIISGIKEEKRFCIYGDYDVDGLMCIRSLVGMFDQLGYDNYTVIEYRKRTHALDKIAPRKCLQNGADIFIVADTGSSAEDKPELDGLVTNDVEVIVLDHHEADFTYEDYQASGIHIINTILENEAGGNYELSAGALCFCVAAAILEKLGAEYAGLSCYAATSLFADCMNMGNELNRSIYYLAKKQKVPTDLLYFMTSFNAFNARYVGYWYAPRVNAMFRSENLNLINRLYITPLDNSVVLGTLLTRVDEVYQEMRDLVAGVCDVLTVTEYNNFVVADLGSVNDNYSVLKNKLWNFTGLVASRLSERYKRAAIVYCTNGESYNGSFRDHFGREFLYAFKSFCKAGGHGAAFGFSLDFQDLQSFLQWISTLDTISGGIPAGNQPVIIDYNYNDPDMTLMRDIATYNEFAGSGVPYVLIRKQVLGSMQTKMTKWGFKSSWGPLRITGSQQLPFGETVLLKPFWANELKLERV